MEWQDVLQVIKWKRFGSLVMPLIRGTVMAMTGSDWGKLHETSVGIARWDLTVWRQILCRATWLTSTNICGVAIIITGRDSYLDVSLLTHLPIILLACCNWISLAGLTDGFKEYFRINPHFMYCLITNWSVIVPVGFSTIPVPMSLLVITYLGSAGCGFTVLPLFPL